MPPLLPGNGTSAASAYLSRGKRSLALNLKDPRAIRIIHRLLADHDIVIEQFRPGVMAKLGLDYAALKEVNPAVIYCSLTGYGQNGPLRDRAGHDINYLALSGLMAYSGRKATGPTLTGMQIADVAAGGHNTVIGVLSAVVARRETGVGQHIDVSMLDGVKAVHTLFAASYLAGGEEPEREESYLNGGSLYDFYETKDGGYLSVGCLEMQFFQAFCEAIHRPDLAPGSIVPPNAAAVKEDLRAIFRTKTRNEWTDIFRNVDACVEPVLTMAEALQSEQIRVREMIVEVTLPDGQSVRQLAQPIRFSETRPEYPAAGPPAGQHTKQVLTALGYSATEITDFEKTGLFA
jgi:crotonobetainyl-CoA:carnitine CoA-transferase CaiB-like acyl-CoA transferase